jgi:hypothetical protein
VAVQVEAVREVSTRLDDGVLLLQKEQKVFRATTPRAVHALASGAVQFATYEVTQTLLGGQS